MGILFIFFIKFTLFNLEFINQCYLNCFLYLLSFFISDNSKKEPSPKKSIREFLDDFFYNLLYYCFFPISIERALKKDGKPFLNIKILLRAYDDSSYIHYFFRRTLALFFVPCLYILLFFFIKIIIFFIVFWFLSDRQTKYDFIDVFLRSDLFFKIFRTRNSFFFSFLDSVFFEFFKLKINNFKFFVILFILCFNIMVFIYIFIYAFLMRPFKNYYNNSYRNDYNNSKK